MSENKIANNPAALDEMMADLAAYDGDLGPGPYWAANQRATLDWLRTNDLNTFRTFEPVGKALANFGGGSWWPHIDVVQANQSALSHAFLHKVSQKLRFGPGINHYGRQAKRAADELRLRNMFLIQLEALCRTRDTENELGGIEANVRGAPSDVLEMDGRPYTTNFLLSFLRYLDMREHIDFDTIDSYVEVGPGAGLFVEVLAKLKTNLNVFLIDIPPQLYVLQQVLQAIFGDRVATYAEIKADPSVLQSREGRIFLIAPWQIDLLELDGVGLAHNSGFGEMRKDTVEAYLSYFTKWKAQYIYICALDIPKTDISIKTDDYDGLLPDHEMLARLQTRSASSLLPRTSTGQVIDIRPASDVCFRRVS
ncbi:MAG: putative sugar O-methyltransferase [Rhodospirillaceae bacterium]|nr:putative sugar O-methyltransferase [Rhodospirillaceae bacterium]